MIRRISACVTLLGLPLAVTIITPNPTPERTLQPIRLEPIAIDESRQ